jgi:hypothetical protein
MRMKLVDKIDHIRSIICRLQDIAPKKGRRCYTSYEIAQFSKLSHSTVYRTLKLMEKMSDGVVV